MFDERRWIRYGNHDYIRASLKEMCTSRRVFCLSTKIWSLYLEKHCIWKLQLVVGATISRCLKCNEIPR